MVTILATSFFAAQITCNATVLLLYGRRAFFEQGLRVASWKHAALSNGVLLPWYGNLMIGPTIIPIVAASVFAVEFFAGRLRTFLAPRPGWMTSLGRLIGAGVLLAFWYCLTVRSGGFHFLHPIPLSALIAASVLLWKTAAAVFRK